MNCSEYKERAEERLSKSDISIGDIFQYHGGFFVVIAIRPEEGGVWGKEIRGSDGDLFFALSEIETLYKKQKGVNNA